MLEEYRGVEAMFLREFIRPCEVVYSLWFFAVINPLLICIILSFAMCLTSLSVVCTGYSIEAPVATQRSRRKRCVVFVLFSELPCAMHVW